MVPLPGILFVVGVLFLVVVIFEVIPSQQWAIIRYYIGV
ncbi:MAG: hypothetical protein [Olavius algarvensis Gamma 1 endosymbiont]|nr:MAG: hypothetical protein [Olavius algarvensis Gamma 1 endosymbiont]